MVMKNLKSGRRLAVLALFAILAMSAFGFAASNTVPDHRAGYGDGNVSGYTVSNIGYTLSATDLNVVEAVTFDLNAAASDVRIQFDSPADIFTCGPAGGNSWSCTTTSVSVALSAIDELRVSAVE